LAAAQPQTGRQPRVPHQRRRPQPRADAEGINRMLTSRSKALIVAAFLIVASVAHAENPGQVDMEAAELTAELIGAPVFASDGEQIGEVVDLSFDEEGQPNKLRMKTPTILGLGERTVEIPKDAFMLLRGAAVLDLPADAVQALPDMADHPDEN